MKIYFFPFTCLSLSVFLFFVFGINTHFESYLSEKEGEYHFYFSEWISAEWSNTHATYGNFFLPLHGNVDFKNEKILILKFVRWEGSDEQFPLPLSLGEGAMINMVFHLGEMELYYYSALPCDAPDIQVRYVLVAIDSKCSPNNALETDKIMQYLKEFEINHTDYPSSIAAR